MDSWPYLESPVPEQNHTKTRLHPGDDLAALTMLYEQCKVNNVESSKPNPKINSNFLTLTTFFLNISLIFIFPEPERAEDYLQPHWQHLQNREVRHKFTKQLL